MVDFAQLIVEMLSNFPPWLIVIVLAMIPLAELRGTILLWGSGWYAPISISQMPWFEIFTLSVIGNMIPVPIILIFFPKVEKWLRRWKMWDRFFTRLFERTRKKASGKIERFKELGVVLFVAIPLPVTGAWTGSLIAYLFDLRPGRAFLAAFVGVAIAGIIMLTLVLVSLVVALALIGVLVGVLMVLSRK